MKFHHVVSHSTFFAFFQGMNLQYPVFGTAKEFSLFSPGVNFVFLFFFSVPTVLPYFLISGVSTGEPYPIATFLAPSLPPPPLF